MRSIDRIVSNRLVVRLVTASLIAVALAAGPFFVERAFGLDPFATLRPDPAAQAEAEWEPVPVELPREWRWERKPITFHHMFREDVEAR